MHEIEVDVETQERDEVAIRTGIQAGDDQTVGSGGRQIYGSGT
jgi:hypothetical protein